MKIYLDTASVSEVREAASLGVLDGVTTNPSLVAKEGKDFKAVLVEICAIVNGPVSAEVVSTDFNGMVREGQELAKIHPNIVVKVPIIKEGLKAIKKLSAEGIRINCTLIFQPLQALLAAKAGASYVSPFVGRLDDVSQTGMEVVGQIRQIFDNYKIETEILAASLRHPMHALEAALMGADIGTMPYPVFEQLLKHPLTDVGLKRFLEDWEKFRNSYKAESLLELLKKA
ncbi:MAG: fructose-6-phosphate aldolase [candidate division Zixibacteria bacterium RBG_16_48_11]|nr:MAG: fructose-6-phosphate aldolase [candidate division Zixibacteria bacterium RBG_16_48_11]